MSLKMDEQKSDNAATLNIISSKELFGNGRLVLIKHGDEMYRLQITRQGKLILNK